MQQRPHEISIGPKDSKQRNSSEARRLLAELTAHQRAVARHVCNSDALRVSETSRQRNKSRKHHYFAVVQHAASIDRVAPCTLTAQPTLAHTAGVPSRLTLEGAVRHLAGQEDYWPRFGG